MVTLKIDDQATEELSGIGRSLELQTARKPAQETYRIGFALDAF